MCLLVDIQWIIFLFTYEIVNCKRSLRYDADAMQELVIEQPTDNSELQETWFIDLGRIRVAVMNQHSAHV